MSDRQFNGNVAMAWGGITLLAWLCGADGGLLFILGLGTVIALIATITNSHQ